MQEKGYLKHHVCSTMTLLEKVYFMGCSCVYNEGVTSSSHPHPSIYIFHPIFPLRSTAISCGPTSCVEKCGTKPGESARAKFRMFPPSSRPLAIIIPSFSNHVMEGESIPFGESTIFGCKNEANTFRPLKSASNNWECQTGKRDIAIHSESGCSACR